MNLKNGTGSGRHFLPPRRDREESAPAFQAGCQAMATLSSPRWLRRACELNWGRQRKTLQKTEGPRNLFLKCISVCSSASAEDRETPGFGTAGSEQCAMPSQETIAWLIRSRRYLAENFRQSMDLRDAAFAAGYSPYHYHRLFKELFGETPWQYVARLRFDEAKRLLCLSSQSVSDVCLDVGYESLASFSTAFSSRCGCPPTEFRRIFTIPFQRTLCWIPRCIFAPPPPGSCRKATFDKRPPGP